jgi:hypothetical protein
MKYIIFEMDGQEFPVIFAGHLNHRDVAKGFGSQMNTARAVPVSAGFVEDLIVRDAVKESMTLDLKSRPEDLKLINHWGGVKL